MRRQFIVEFDVPVGANITDCKRYIREAIDSWGGSLRPPGAYDEEDDGDPFFGGPTNITVKHLGRKP